MKTVTLLLKKTTHHTFFYKMHKKDRKRIAFPVLNISQSLIVKNTRLASRQTKQKGQTRSSAHSSLY